MSMSVGSVNNSYATYSTQKTRQNSQIGKIEATQEDYIKKIQEKNCGTYGTKSEKSYCRLSGPGRNL